MATAIASDWTTANQQYLMAHVRRVAGALRRHASEPGGGETDANGVDDAAAALPAPAALDSLCAAFALSAFERDVLVLCAGVELDAMVASLCAAASGDSRGAYPTFSLALAALPGGHWTALSPGGPLRRWRLVAVLPGDSLTTSPLRIEERVLHHLAGAPAGDDHLIGLVQPLASPPALPPSHAELANRIAGLWSDASVPPLVQLCGDDATARRAVAAAACADMGMRLQVVDGAALPAQAAEREALARLLEREAVLTGAATLLDCDRTDEPDRLRAAALLAEAIGGPRMMSRREPVDGLVQPFLRVDVPAPRTAERLALWRDALGPHADQAGDGLEGLVRQFELGPERIRAAALECHARMSLEPAEACGDVLWEAARVQARPRLDDLAQRVDPAATWDDLVLPEPELAILRDIAIHLRHRTTVYDDWGFAAKGGRGLGITALFAGASGTGKTMAAEVLAGELRLDLYRIDLSSVVSKWIGETEKNLRRLFDAAEAGGAILLFDEADALFGKRSEVKDSHDRYANIEVSYLLQRMESYRGLAVLTTNLRAALDPAFLRRIRFVIQFPFPDAAQRTAIWRGIFPYATPTDGLDPAALAKLSVTGGHIRNIAMGAAFLAADAGEPVRMAHLLQAARREYAKLERPLTDAEVGGWT